MPPAAKALLAGWLILLAAAPAAGVEHLTGSIERIRAEDWRVEGLTFAVDLSAAPLTGVVSVARLELPGAGFSFTDTRIACERVDISPAELACRDAQVSLELPDLGHRTFPGELVQDRRTGAVRFALRQVPLAGGGLDVEGTAGGEVLEVSFEGHALSFADLAAVTARYAPELAALNPTGSVDVRGSLRARGGAVARVEMQGAFRGASAANEAGTIVAAEADAEFRMLARRTEDGFEIAAELGADAGEAYVEPVYANLSDTPLHLSAEGVAASGGAGLALRSITFRQGSAIAASGTLDLRLPPDAGPLVSGTLEIEHAALDALYGGLLQVLAAGTLLGDLETAGIVSGTVSFAENAPTSADLTFEGVVADDREGRISVHGLEGSVHWPGPGGEPGDAPPSRLRWEGASAFSIPFGGGSVTLALGGDDLELLDPLKIPTLGGAVRVNRLRVSNFGREDAGGLLDAALDPVQLGQLSAAFGWPAFSGTLSGRLPLLRYDARVMTLGGTLRARAFDGDIEIENLTLEEPFGLVPRVSGDVRLRDLDLTLVTNTFSFGFIQGRLSGDVTGLQLVGWRPVAMDLHLYTPAGDDSRHRISQRAIENLASVGGGGAAAALSSGFMKFFQVFRYDEIGLRCVLEDGTCTMSGAGPAGRDELGGGYYIVRGSGLPRIDVVGYRSQVSWSRLVRQLENILETGTPVVE